jgi:hypothetical protein
VSFYSTQSWGVIQVFCGSQDQIRVIIKNTKRRVAAFAQHPPNIIRVMAVIYRKLVLLQLKRLLTNSTIIPLKFQEQFKICGGQPKTRKPIYIGFASTTEKVVFAPVNDQVFSGKLTRTHSARGHFETPMDRTGA